MIMSPSSRWNPTPEQLMMLEEIYRGGIKTPNATQIQKITSQLSLYGKIEGKNVFYWFQNHKARDRQKLRRKLLLTQQLIYQQQQQQLLYHPPNYHHHFLHHLPSFTPPRRHSLQVGGRRINVEDTSTRGMNCKWKGDLCEKRKIHDDSSSLMINKTRNDDWKMIMMDVCASPALRPRPPPRDKPLKTLQLFPIASTASTIATSPSSSPPPPASPISSGFHLDL